MEEEKENKSWQRELQDTQNLSDLWLFQSDFQADWHCIMMHLLILDWIMLTLHLKLTTAHWKMQ